MFLTTPERQRPVLPAVDSFARTSPRLGMLLPPLSSLLSDATPFRPRLPSIDSFTTPQAQVYMMPSARSSGGFSGSFPRYEKPTLSVSTKGSDLPANLSRVANVTADSDADTSVNDSMVKVAKRKASNTSPSRDFAFISHSPATYPSQEPSIDNASLARRKRRRTSPHELSILNQEFQMGSTPSKARRIEIAKKVSMTEKAVQIWFQNKRQSLRRLKSTDKEVTELPPTPDSSSVMLAIPTDLAPTPLNESTPIKPALLKAHSQLFVEIPAIAQLSPIRSFSTSSLVQKHPAKEANPLLTKMLAAGEDRKPRKEADLVLSLTNKKQPEFARQSPAAATQVRTFKLAPPKERKPLGVIDTNVATSSSGKSNELQCVHGLLSLKGANY